MDAEEKVRENRLRRVLARRGYVLSRSRRRDRLALDYGRYEIRTGTGGVLVHEARSLDGIERWASAQEAAAAQSGEAR